MCLALKIISKRKQLKIAFCFYLAFIFSHVPISGPKEGKGSYYIS